MSVRGNKLREMLDGETLWGLPEKISDELVDSYSSGPMRWIGFSLFMVVMVGGFGIGALIWAHCERKIQQNAIETSQAINGFAYEVNFGIGLLVGLFVWIFMTGLIVSLIIRVTPMPTKGALFLSGYENLSKKAPKKLLEEVQTSGINKPRTAAELLNQYLDKSLRKSAIGLAPFVILVIGVTYAELSWYSVMSHTGLHKTSFISEKMSVKTWADAERVQLGCNQTDDGGNLIYEVIWPDGYDKRLPTDTHFNGTDWLTNLERVDAEIMKGGAEFVRWEWLNRNPLHPRCLRGFYSEGGADRKARIDRLLRIGELD